MTVPDAPPAMSDEETRRLMAEASRDADATMAVEPHDDRTREFRTPGYSRMVTYAQGHQDHEVTAMIGLAENLIVAHFTDAFWLINEIWDVVREPEVNTATGEVIKDRFGYNVWRRRSNGSYVEDWSKLGTGERTRFIHLISTHLFEWQQRAADMWGEAMFAKARWEEAYANGFQALPNDRPRPTEADRTNHARTHSVDERYYGIWRALVSRKADAIVSSLELLNQRLKDTTNLS